jgi:hypothetical protein
MTPLSNGLRLEPDGQRRSAAARPRRWAEEQGRLHPLPTRPFTVTFGKTRRVNWGRHHSVSGSRYSVPHELIDIRVWGPLCGDELIITVSAVGGHCS